MRKLIAVFVFLYVSLAFAQDDPPRFLRRPAVSGTQIVFNYAGDLWIVGRDGGEARRLTSAAGVETDPVFSPDGIAGRLHRRVRRQPGRVRRAGGAAACPAGSPITPARTRVARLDARRQDGPLPLGPRQLLPAPSTSSTRSRSTGGLPESCRSPSGRAGRLLPGRHPHRLRAAPPVAARLEALPRRPDHAHLDRRPHGLRDREDPARRTPTTRTPIWVGDRVYFLSDRNGPVTLLRLRHQDEAGARGRSGTTGSTSSRPPPEGDAIVYEQFGALNLYDLSTRELEDRQRPPRGRLRRGAAALREGGAEADPELRLSPPPAPAP